MFDNKHYGMITKVWGPPGWLFLHCVTFGYPYEIDNTNADVPIKYANFFNALGDVLPCKTCSVSYKENIARLPVEKFLGSRRDLTYWLYQIHNMVNDKLNIPACNIPTFQQVVDRYERYRSTCTPELSKRTGCKVPNGWSKKWCDIKINHDTLNYTPFVVCTIILLLILYIIYLKVT